MQTVENKAKEFFEKSKKDFGKMQKQVPDTISGFSGDVRKDYEERCSERSATRIAGKLDRCF